jgi:WD40 repeat protein
LVVGGAGMLVQLNVTTGAELRTFEHPTPGPFYTAAASSADGRFLLSSLVVGERPQTAEPRSIGISSNDLQTAQRRYPQIVTLWNRESGDVVRDLPLDDSVVRYVAFSADGATFYTISYTTIRFFKTETGEPLVTFDAATLAAPTQSPGIFVAATVSPDLRFAAVSMLNDVLVLSTESRDVQSRFAQLGHFAGMARHLSFSDNRCCLEVADLQGRFFSWRLTDGGNAYFGASPQPPGTMGGFFSGPAAMPFAKLAYDPARAFILEQSPPDFSQTCRKFRQVRLPPPAAPAAE